MILSYSVATFSLLLSFSVGVANAVVAPRNNDLLRYENIGIVRSVVEGTIAYSATVPHKNTPTTRRIVSSVIRKGRISVPQPPYAFGSSAASIPSHAATATAAQNFELNCFDNDGNGDDDDGIHDVQTIDVPEKLTMTIAISRTLKYATAVRGGSEDAGGDVCVDSDDDDNDDDMINHFYAMVFTDIAYFYCMYQIVGTFFPSCYQKYFVIVMMLDMLFGIFKVRFFTGISQAEMILQHRTGSHDGVISSSSTLLYYGINVSDDKFKIWLQHQFSLEDHDSGKIKLTNVSATKNMLMFRNRKVSEELSTKWKQQRVLLGNASLFHSVYTMMVRYLRNPLPSSPFHDQLLSCSKMFWQVVEDTIQDEKEDGDGEQQVLQFLYDEYGDHNTTKIEASQWNTLQTKDKKFETMQHFLDWFRSVFPYYYDGCKSCSNNNSTVMTDINLLGRIYPNETEVKEGKAGHIELYHCNECGAVTQFPRYNAAKFICRNRSGRCGEYSLLLYRMLHALGHNVRYVVDAGNGHVWVEVLMIIPGNDKRNTKKRNQQQKQTQQWLHLDPCEAALNNNLLYQEWGRSIDRVFAFYAPPPTTSEILLSDSNNSDPKYNSQQQQQQLMEIPIIEDVTQSYTTNAKQSQIFRRPKYNQRVIDEVALLQKNFIADAGLSDKKIIL